MPFQNKNGLRFYQFDIFSETVINAVFTRDGGVSPAPWNSLNLSISVGDDPAHVTENRTRAFDALGRNLASLHDAHLVHGVDIIYADTPRPANQPIQKADILFTDNPEVSLFMRYADCVPLLFHDPKQNVIGLAHAGWMGTVKGVAEVAIKAMLEKYNCKPEDIVAGIGPSISIDHYEVGEDVASQFREKYADDAEKVLQNHDGKTYLDLWRANVIQLQKSGVEHIQVSGLCTACHLGDWFSHRAEKGKTGRFGVLMALKKA
ncbi:MAG: peptidoglycan editing factor PgeF [Anaerolineales bacterium]|nr:peptidoglycan editing factor PgeF [Anaerolineales bacterium]